MNISIWWLDQKDCEAIGEKLPARFPQYLKDQYLERYGRVGRGRLWAAAEFKGMDVAAEPWPKTAIARRLAEDSGGIVIHDKDAAFLQSMPGVLTDTKLYRVDISIFA